jgi:hypothetical protein
MLSIATIMPASGGLAMTPTEPDRVFSARGWLSRQPQLGEMANISRHHVNRILGTMRRAGWVDARYNRIRLLDVAALKAFAWTDE